MLNLVDRKARIGAQNLIISGRKHHTGVSGIKPDAPVFLFPIERGTPQTILTKKGVSMAKKSDSKQTALSPEASIVLDKRLPLHTESLGKPKPRKEK